MAKEKIKSFTDLIVWQKGHQLVLKIYSLTATFPKEEIFGLASQLKRSAVSFTSDIAEGFSRISFKDKLRFYSMALGSLTESQNQLLVAKDLSYISGKDFQNIADQTVILSKLTNGLIKKSKTIIHNS